MTDWPADQVERRSVDALIPYARNARTHSEEQVAQLAASIREWGWTVPVLVDEDGSIIAGHGRVMAARKLGLTDVPTMTARGWTEAQKRAYVLADNQLALNAGWDAELLRVELGDLSDVGFDLGLTGFGEAELGELLAPSGDAAGLTDPDETPAVEDRVIAESGDVWTLGRHRLICGDSTDASALQRLFAGAQADFCFTSPPYNAATVINIEGEGKSLYRNNASDNRGSAEYVQFNADVFDAMQTIAAPTFVCCYNINYNKKSPSEYIDVVYEAKKRFPLRETIAWEKAMAVSLHGDNLTRIFEFVFVFARGRFTVNKASTDCLKNLWKISNSGANHENHKACFPVALPEQGIRYFAPHGAKVFEPFCGTGSTLIAAETTGCNAFCVELDPAYIDVAVRRWQSFTGQAATLESDGRTFGEIMEARHDPAGRVAA